MHEPLFYQSAGEGYYLSITSKEQTLCYNATRDKEKVILRFWTKIYPYLVLMMFINHIYPFNITNKSTHPRHLITTKQFVHVKIYLKQENLYHRL